MGIISKLDPFWLTQENIFKVITAERIPFCDLKHIFATMPPKNGMNVTTLLSTLRHYSADFFPLIPTRHMGYDAGSNGYHG